MVKALFDTNILIDFLNGNEPARQELSLYEEKAISMVTWMEVMVGASDENGQATAAFLRSFRCIAIDQTVAERAVALRRGHRLKLPDAIVWASALAHDMVLVTRDTKDLPGNHPGIRIPYRL
ncbi:type II toxin-antitoxin system VapC family toxin [Agrobacterium vitis]|uniref:type II toxin-antitoxin system VapC family toxin n=1 Tax=Agrobacterium vitis TaxID=373 RepID=UPI001573D740|nr:type II toxin-antitoxin system VapC family toxin [Agrobacterium vitis]NSZ15968.1 type II toxin-antitoxin system VapC family toxin [Agrobacterium vitis]QZO04760.1 type II toxin-antitoxin system VapC family toxin [Agrobacterium vitis]UJL86904.1 type II toxin-antitoxin system VapC family toxin [Agrobacterium vitis]